MLRLKTVLSQRGYVSLAVAGVLAAIVGLPIAWYLGSPLFIDQKVNEAFPTIAPAVVQPTVPPTIAAPTIAPAVIVATGAPVAIAPTVPPTVAPPTTVPPTPTPAGPVRLGQGSFSVVDTVHKGSGEATFYRLPDGQVVLRLEDNFKVTNGPDLYIYLAGHAAPRTSMQLHENGAFEVAQLKGNIGGQNYTLPADFDPAQYKSVVIYCKRFTTVFSTAEISGG